MTVGGGGGSMSDSSPALERDDEEALARQGESPPIDQSYAVCIYRALDDSKR